MALVHSCEYCNHVSGSSLHQACSRVHGVQDLRESGVRQAQEAGPGQQHHQGQAGEARQGEERRTMIPSFLPFVTSSFRPLTGPFHC